MKRFSLILSIAILLLACNRRETTVNLALDDIPVFKPTIVLMHPTVRNIKTFRYLTGEGILPFPEDYKALGVYHSKGSYDYKLSKDYILQENLAHFRLFEVGEKLSPENIYQKNDCSIIFRTVFENSKGIIFFGGPDIPPACYGEPTNLLTVITDVHRHYLELSMLFHMLGGYQDTLFSPMLNNNPDYPVLGICLGMQTINVATGGTLIQDIPAEIYNLNSVEDILSQNVNKRHRNYHTNLGVDDDLIRGDFHQIDFDEGSLFDSLNAFSSKLPYVWSSHHQTPGKLGKDLVAIAWSPDGKVVEAIKHKRFKNVTGIQFHPEVVSIFESDDKLAQYPFQEDKQSYIDMFPGEKGENFHRAFWKYIGEKYCEQPECLE